MTEGLISPALTVGHDRNIVAAVAYQRHKQMKIAFVTTGYKPRINGMTSSIEAFTQNFTRLGHEVTIVASRYPHYRDEEENVVRIGSHYLFFDPEDRLANPWLPSSRRIIKRLIAERYDVVHTHTHFFLEMDAIRWARRMGCPIVYTYHTLFENYVRHYAKFFPASTKVALFKWWNILYCRQMDLIFVPSSPVRDMLRSYGVGNRIEVNPTGIDLGKFVTGGGGDFRKQHGISDTTRVLLFVGRIGGEKNIDFLFRVVKRVVKVYPDTLFLLAGDGPARAELTKLARRQGLAGSVKFLGYMTHDTLVPCYDAADLFIFASFTETQGLVLTEAMAVGTPVVAVGRLGVIDVMRGNVGGLMVGLDENDFTAAVLGLLGNPALYAHKRAEALSCARAWSIESMADRMIGFYSDLIERKRRHV